jgi:hypothetical protein
VPDSRLSGLLQTSSHVLLLGGGLVYLFGFIIVSVFDATYGIANFSFFRAKVIGVGLLFVVLVGIAMLVTFRMFAFFGLTPEHQGPAGIVVTPENRLFAITYVGVSIPFACAALTWPLVFVFAKYPHWTGKGLGLWVFLSMLVAATQVFLKKWHDTHPFLLVLLAALCAAALLIVLFRYTDRAIFWFTIWLSAVSAFTVNISLKIHKPEEARKVEWERSFMTVIPVVFFLYAAKVYPNIRHELGGGSPVPVVLHFTKKLPVFNSESISVFLIDETEDGYYVTHGSDKAIFIAHNLVEEVEFLHADSVPANP